MTNAAQTSNPSSATRKPPEKRQTVLLVDDDRALRAILTIQLEEMGYTIIEAANGEEALEVLQTAGDTIDAIVLDREMPVMNGMDFINKIKTEAKVSAPIVMVTGSGKPSHVSEGIEAGVFYYLVKPIHFNVFSNVMSAAMREAQRMKRMLTILQKQSTGLCMLTKGSFTIQTLQEAEYLAALLANCYKDPERIISGLLALMTNAIEHGNLDIGFEEKGRLLAENRWNEEIAQRQSGSNTKIMIAYEKTAGAQIIRITDEGGGFDWKPYMEVDPSTVEGAHGRGIATARLRSFDQVFYNQSGNEVTAIVHVR